MRRQLELDISKGVVGLAATFCESLSVEIGMTTVRS